MSAQAATSLLPLELWAPLDRAAPRLPTRWASWLTATGSLETRIAREAGTPATVHVLEERISFLSNEQIDLLAAPADSCFQRRVELRAAGRPWIYAETLVPDHTLEAHPWLADLGERSLEDALAWRDDVERGPLEVATLPASHPLAARATPLTRDPQDAIWARRGWVAVAGNRLLIHELFLPEPHKR